MDYLTLIMSKNNKKQQQQEVQDKVVKKVKLVANNPSETAIVKEDMLTADFYKIGVVELARALIGKVIVRKLPEGEIRAMIVETEAYKAPEDKACHAYNNKKTDKTKYFW